MRFARAAGERLQPHAGVAKRPLAAAGGRSDPHARQAQHRLGEHGDRRVRLRIDEQHRVAGRADHRLRWKRGIDEVHHGLRRQLVRRLAAGGPRGEREPHREGDRGGSRRQRACHGLSLRSGAAGRGRDYGRSRRPARGYHPRMPSALAVLLLAGAGLSTSTLAALPAWTGARATGDWLVRPVSGEGGRLPLAATGRSSCSRTASSRARSGSPRTRRPSALDNLATGEALLRAVTPEALVDVDGRSLAVGGLVGQPNRAFLKPEWLERMSADPAALRFAGFEVGATAERLAWGRVRTRDQHGLAAAGRVARAALRDAGPAPARHGRDRGRGPLRALRRPARVREVARDPQPLVPAAARRALRGGGAGASSSRSPSSRATPTG